jgi:hypothetical protein
MASKPKKKGEQDKSKDVVERVVYVEADPGYDPQEEPDLAEFYAHPTVVVLKGPAPTPWTGETWASLAADALRKVVGPGWFMELLDYLASLKECPLREWCRENGGASCQLASYAASGLVGAGSCLERRLKELLGTG